MRHQDVIGVAAIAEDAEEARTEAQLLLAALANRAGAAAEPGKDQALVADLGAARLRAQGDDLADRLVPHGQRQLDAALGQLEFLAAAEVVMAFPDMDVAVADAGGENAQQHLAAARLRRRPLEELKGRAALGDIVAFHDGPPLAIFRTLPAM